MNNVLQLNYPSAVTRRASTFHLQPLRTCRVLFNQEMVVTSRGHRGFRFSKIMLKGGDLQFLFSEDKSFNRFHRLDFRGWTWENLHTPEETEGNGDEITYRYLFNGNKISIMTVMSNQCSFLNIWIMNIRFNSFANFQLNEIVLKTILIENW